MKRHNVHLPDQQWSALVKQADKTGLQVAELIRRAIDLYLAKQPKGN